MRPLPAPIPLVQRVDHLLDRARGRRVLHLGCTNAPYTATGLVDGSLLHLRLHDVAAELHGTDIDRAGLDALAAQGINHLHHGDLRTLRTPLSTLTFDLIVAGEIIEHLSNPGSFLDDVKQVMSANTSLIITTVNAYCGFRMAQYALRGRGGRAEPVHPEHVAYYSYATLTRLAADAGLHVVDTRFYDLGREHLPYTRAALRWINRAVTSVAPHLADGLIVECRLPPVTSSGR
jgi:predicted TPR repeat methyltransferase